MEVEVKVRIGADALEGLRARLRGMDGTVVTFEQDDVFFRHPCRDLPGNDEAFRLRREGGRSELTYKGPREPGDIKARPEHNLIVTGDPVPLLEALGFKPAARLRKTRESWTLGGAEVALDHIEGLGWFVEIEAKDHGDPHEHVDGLRRQLGLESPPVRESYLELALAAGVDAAGLL